MKCYEKNYQFHFKDLSEIINNILNVLDINFKKRNYQTKRGKQIENQLKSILEHWKKDEFYDRDKM